MRYFFYGTLMDPAVLAVVIGRHLPPASRQPASLADVRRVYRAGAHYPILIPAAGERVEGLLVDGLGAADGRRLDVFEGRDYVAQTASVQPQRGGPVLAWLFMPRPHVPASALTWTPEHWRRHHRRVYFERLLRTGRPS